MINILFYNILSQKVDALINEYLLNCHDIRIYSTVDFSNKYLFDVEVVSIDSLETFIKEKNVTIVVLNSLGNLTKNIMSSCQVISLCKQNTNNVKHIKELSELLVKLKEHDNAVDVSLKINVSKKSNIPKKEHAAKIFTKNRISVKNAKTNSNFIDYNKLNDVMKQLKYIDYDQVMTFNCIENKVLEMYNVKNEELLFNPQYTYAYESIRSNNLNAYNFINNYEKLFEKNIDDINNDNKNILVFDMIYMDGGSYMYLQYLIAKYKDKYNFIIVRELSLHSHNSHTTNNISINLNDDFLIKQNINMDELTNYLSSIKYEFIFINSLATQSIKYKKYVKDIDGYKITISHDFSLL